MDVTSSSAARPSRTKRPAAPSRQRAGSAGGAGGAGQAWRRGLLAGCAAAVFAAVFMVDTAGVGRLIWACLAGHEGSSARFVALGILLPSVCVIVFAFRQPNRGPHMRAGKKAVRPVRVKGGSEQAGTPKGGRNGARSASESGQKTAAKRRAKPGSDTVIE